MWVECIFSAVWSQTSPSCSSSEQHEQIAGLIGRSRERRAGSGVQGTPPLARTRAATARPSLLDGNRLWLPGGRAMLIKHASTQN